MAFDTAHRILDTIIRHSDASIAEPVIDRLRFPDRTFVPSTPEQVLWGLREISTHAAAIDAAAALFADDASRQLFEALLVFRVLGPCRYALPLATQAYLDQYAAEAGFRVHPTERRLHWPQSLYRLEFLGQPLEIDMWDGNVAATFLRRQYFFERDGWQVAPAPGDTVIDGGGCIGDTALAFAAAVGAAGQVFTLEPIPANAALLRENLARNPALAGRIECLPYALAERSGERVQLVEADAGSHVTRDGGLACETLAIDALVESRGLRVGFIKMDIEGSEVPALLGAARTLARQKPRLAISAYHRRDDLWTLLALIHRLNPGYRFFLDHYTNHAEETVLYAC